LIWMTRSLRAFFFSRSSLHIPRQTTLYLLVFVATLWIASYIFLHFSSKLSG
jgi:hypothetical protein